LLPPLGKRNQGEPVADLLHDSDSVVAGITRTKWQSGQRGVHLAERSQRTELILACGKEFPGAGIMVRM
jgi:hypothetical protein